MSDQAVATSGASRLTHCPCGWALPDFILSLPAGADTTWAENDPPTISVVCPACDVVLDQPLMVVRRAE